MPHRIGPDVLWGGLDIYFREMRNLVIVQDAHLVNSSGEWFSFAIEITGYVTWIAENYFCIKKLKELIDHNMKTNAFKGKFLSSNFLKRKS